MTKPRLVPWILALFFVACGTTGDAGDSPGELPSAGVGPFRALGATEVKGIAPFVLEDSAGRYREPAVLAGVGGDDGVTFLYAVAQASATAGTTAQDVIVRTRATDGRTFFGASSASTAKPAVVLAADQAWEGGDGSALSGPSLFRRAADVLLYYAAAGGIGVARSTDGAEGRAFAKLPGPVLAPAVPGSPASSWETTAPRAPSVYALPDGGLRMLYAAGSAIGEAESADGIAWTRLDEGRAPVFTPSGGAAFDAAAVDDPCAAPRITPAGRLLVRVLYTGTDGAGTTSIGFAGRFGDAGPFTRDPDPVYAVHEKEAAPALLESGGTSWLYVEQELVNGEKTWPAIAAAIAGATATLPPTSAFPTAP